MTIEIGTKAPLFSLYDTDKNEVKLEDLTGENVVLLFFPLAFTGTCTTELCTIRDSYSKYQSLEAKVFAISVDSIFALGKYKEEQNYNFSLLSDFNKEVSKAYGVLYEEFVLDMKGVSMRAVFVIDRKGIVKYSEILEKASDLPKFSPILDCLTKLK